MDSNLKALMDDARAFAEPKAVERGALVYNPSSRGVTDLERFANAPSYVRGVAQFLSAESFSAYWKTFSGKDSLIYADTNPAAPSVVGVLNHYGTEPEWADHRAVMVFRKTPEWLAWTESDKVQMNQVDFAEFIEDNLKDIVAPPPGDLLEIAQTLQAKRDAEFRSATRLQDGSYEFLSSEEITAKAGKTGQLQIPPSFTLGLVPFEGGAPYKVVARLRYRIVDGRVYFQYALERSADIVRAAVGDTLAKIAELTGQSALLGSPMTITPRA